MDKLVEDMAKSDPIDREERDATAKEIDEAETSVITVKAKKKTTKKPVKKKKTTKGTKKKSKK